MSEPWLGDMLETRVQMLAVGCSRWTIEAAMVSQALLFVVWWVTTVVWNIVTPSKGGNVSQSQRAPKHHCNGRDNRGDRNDI